MNAWRRCELCQRCHNRHDAHLCNRLYRINAILPAEPGGKGQMELNKGNIHI